MLFKKPSESGASGAATVQEVEVLNALRSVMDPDLHRDIVSLGFVKNIKICGGAVAFDVELTTPACPVKDRLKAECQDQVAALPGVQSVAVNMTAAVRGRGAEAMGGNSPAEALRSVKNLIAVASGKGGVGKSTVSANLALALQRTGAVVGLMDADVYGPSIPRMMGIRGDAMANEQGQIIPMERFGIKVVSMGFLTRQDSPVIWRGPMVSKIVQQFLGGVDWGALDYLVIDLPPGTGDIQLTLTQSAPLNGAVIVTTPQEMAVEVARRGLRMFQQVNVPVLGVVENMSHFVCPHCHESSNLFPHGSVERTCSELGLPLLGRIPIDARLAEAGDIGEPIVLRDPEAPSSRAFAQLAGRVAAELSKANLATAGTSVKPTNITPVGDTEMSITWDDGHVSHYTFRNLRANCACASCVDEWTGERRLDLSSIPADIHPVETAPVGRYAIHFLWSDGHGSGIYSFDRLRALCECPECRAA